MHRLPLLLKLFVASLFFVFVLASCKNEMDNYVFDYQYEYYPTDTGHYVIYDVDSILYTYNNNYTRDTVHYQLKELIADTFYDNLNDLNYRLELYRRKDSTQAWVIDRVWFIKRTNNTIQKIEGDLRFVKLVFPPVEDQEWSGNQYIPNTTTEPYKVFKDWIYTYTAVNAPYSINGLSFDSTVTVTEIDDQSLIEKFLRKEVYAKNVGMIYQEWEILNKQNVIKDWESGAENGFKIRMRMREHN